MGNETLTLASSKVVGHLMGLVAARSMSPAHIHVDVLVRLLPHGPICSRSSVRQETNSLISGAAR